MQRHGTLAPEVRALRSGRRTNRSPKGGTARTGISNFSAQNNLRAMKKGVQAFFYHTGRERVIVGIVKVTAEAHPDSTDSAWRAVDVTR
jgi:predicted RNA-binding protein with PUA-like domain